jgi:hypothetical protein
MIGLLSVGITAATAAQAGTVKLFTAQWYTESFGNECKGTTLPQMTPGGALAPKCTRTSPDFSKYSVFAVPQGQLCNADQPRCPISSTPNSGPPNYKWSPLGGAGQKNTATVWCGPISGSRPANGDTLQGTMTFRIPPVYRNPHFFTVAGQPRLTGCTGTSTGVFPSDPTRFGQPKGFVQKGNPITGSFSAVATGPGHKDGFNIAAAPPNPGPYGLRTTSLIGEVANDYPYIYSYTYGTLRNNKGIFGPGNGPGGFTYKYVGGKAGSTVASIMQAAGTAKFGGTMKMLGAMTTKVCYWLRAGGGGCSLGVNDWRYDAIGVSAPTVAGVVTMGNIAYTNYTRYYNTAQGAYSAVTAVGVRFPWTTGALTVTAIGRGPHKTVHYAQGYDNRNVTTSLGKGTIQMVSPIITRWFGYSDYETAGIAILRIKFVPEPQTWAILIAGVSLLGVGYRMRGR